MDKYIKDQDLVTLSKEFSIDLRLVKTVVAIESSGKGFDYKTGLIKIQFEPYWFQIYTGIRVSNGVDTQRQEWKAYEAAKEISEKSAMLSTSWGSMQVMGFNHIKAGYSTVEKMVEAFEESEYNQIKGGLSFIVSNKPMYTALQNKNWAGFARHYNGKLYKKFKYDTKLASYYERLT